MNRDSMLTRKVRKAYRRHMLAQICTLPESKFGGAFGMQTVPLPQVKPSKWDTGPAEDYYHFRDNGSSVLAVAHLDTVVSPHERKPHFYDVPGRGPVIRSGALDDRLGAYVILGLLPQLGINTDVLLTVGEESAASTAQYFQPSKQYDWIIEFDRTGTDVVMYQFEDEPSRRAVEDSGAEMGSGSYSDIAYLEHLGVKAFNWGVGYRGNYHSPAAYAYLSDTFAMVAKYARFHKQNAGQAMTHDPATSYDGYGSWKDAAGQWIDECIFCFARNSVNSAGYCDKCNACQECGEDWMECSCYVTAHSLRDSADSAAGHRHWKDDAEGKDTEQPADAIAGARALWKADTAD